MLPKYVERSSTYRYDLTECQWDIFDVDTPEDGIEKLKIDQRRLSRSWVIP